MPNNNLFFLILQLVIASPAWVYLLRAIGQRNKNRADIQKTEAQTVQAEAQADNLDARASEAIARASDLMLGQLNAQLSRALAEIAALKQENVERDKAHKIEREEWIRQINERDQLQARMQNEMNELRGGIQVLIAQFKENSITPRWQPKAAAEAGLDL